MDDTLVTPDEVAERLAMLQDRFASLKGVQRPVADGDHVSIDLSASVDGKPVEDAQASGLSYPVGSESLLDGLDEALIGMSAGESATFSSELAGGDFAGQEADVTVTVHSVKAKEVPGLDDEVLELLRVLHLRVAFPLKNRPHPRVDRAPEDGHHARV